VGDHEPGDRVVREGADEDVPIRGFADVATKQPEHAIGGQTDIDLDAIGGGFGGRSD
jgi:hypothetical protein